MMHWKPCGGGRRSVTQSPPQESDRFDTHACVSTELKLHRSWSDPVGVDICQECKHVYGRRDVDVLWWRQQARCHTAFTFC
jgi:hypothetical protein